MFFKQSMSDQIASADMKYRGRGFLKYLVLVSLDLIIRIKTKSLGFHIFKMATIQRLAKQAFITFRTKESPTFASNLEKLKNLLDKLTADDINLSLPNEQLDAIVPPTREAPVSHIGIYECPYFSMGVFIIKKGCEIPLHDHPSMYGLCKVLYGKIKVRCYSLSSDGNSEAVNGTVKQKRAIRCQVMNDMTYDSSTGSCVLTPMIGNYHSIHAVPGPTAFLDILAPPYAPQEERDCNYYKECDQMPTFSQDVKTDEKDRVRWLIPVNPPRDFYCDSQVYTGPEIIL